MKIYEERFAWIWMCTNANWVNFWLLSWCKINLLQAFHKRICIFVQPIAGNYIEVVLSEIIEKWWSHDQIKTESNNLLHLTKSVFLPIIQPFLSIFEQPNIFITICRAPYLIILVYFLGAKFMGLKWAWLPWWRQWVWVSTIH